VMSLQFALYSAYDVDCICIVTSHLIAIVLCRVFACVCFLVFSFTFTGFALHFGGSSRSGIETWRWH